MLTKRLMEVGRVETIPLQFLLFKDDIYGYFRKTCKQHYSIKAYMTNRNQNTPKITWRISTKLKQHLKAIRGENNDNYIYKTCYAPRQKMRNLFQIQTRKQILYALSNPHHDPND